MGQGALGSSRWVVAPPVGVDGAPLGRGSGVRGVHSASGTAESEGSTGGVMTTGGGGGGIGIGAGRSGGGGGGMVWACAASVDVDGKPQAASVNAAITPSRIMPPRRAE
ncbi:hypothetical protein LRS12_03685 [Sphingomonas sp. J344]|uniref:hypothetical protein n=1 Tax=Sphingomonas sp. J344 TaxID=2898434 RepID=UPI002150FCC9|nr:hypothetical protein [Sphingomonas sp. J344]MCR5869928.1 hypothetical protein [Sphingomonas sp. J344]